MSSGYNSQNTSYMHSYVTQGYLHDGGIANNANVNVVYECEVAGEAMR